MNLINSNTALSTVNKEKIGNKAYQLFVLKDAHLTTPDFFCIPVEEVEKFIEPINGKIEEIVNSIDTQNLLQKSKDIQNLFQTTEWTEESEEAIMRLYSSFLGKDTYVAVRSSAIDEDGKFTSFAGQHQSFLFVKDRSILQKIKASIASAWSLNALGYRLAHSLSLNHIRISIIVQKMIKAEKSGIGFSMDVQGNMANMIVVAGFGIGEGVVQDKVETDTFFIQRQNQKITEIITKKKTKLFFSSEKSLHIKSLHEKYQNQAVHTSEELRQIARLLSQAESLLETVADIEYSFDNSGQLFILQMRPVSNLSLNEIKILDNTNIGENYSEISLPLTFSFVSKAYSNVFKRAYEAFRIPLKAQNQDFFDNLLGYYYGRIYYRLDNWYKMMSPLFTSRESMKSWEKAVGLKRDRIDEKHINYGQKFKIYLSSFFIILRYKRGNRLFFERFEKNYTYICNYPEQASARELNKHLQLSSEYIFKDWYRTLINDLISFKSYGYLVKMIKKYKLGEEALANELLSGRISSNSEKAIVHLLYLCRDINKSTELKVLFQENSETIIQALSKGQHTDFQQQINLYLEVFGERTLSELKLEVKTLKQNPKALIDLLKNQLESNIDIDTFLSRQQNVKRSADQILNDNLKWWQWRKYKFKIVLKIVAYALRHRENMRFARAKIYGIAKEIFLRIGEDYAKNGILDFSEDIFYLTMEEIEEITKNSKAILPKEVVNNRKLEYKDYACIEVPDRIIYSQKKAPIIIAKSQDPKPQKSIFKGIAVSSGIVEAKAKIILEADYSISLKNKILVAKVTDPGWVFLMSQSAGMISERGSLLSHTAIVGRELNIPVVVGIEDATKLLSDNDTLRMDGNTGTVEILSTNE